MGASQLIQRVVGELRHGFALLRVGEGAAHFQEVGVFELLACDPPPVNEPPAQSQKVLGCISVVGSARV